MQLVQCISELHELQYHLLHSYMQCGVAASPLDLPTHHEYAHYMDLLGIGSRYLVAEMVQLFLLRIHSHLTCSRSLSSYTVRVVTVLTHMRYVTPSCNTSSTFLLAQSWCVAIDVVWCSSQLVFHVSRCCWSSQLVSWFGLQQLVCWCRHQRGPALLLLVVSPASPATLVGDAVVDYTYDVYGMDVLCCVVVNEVVQHV